MNVYLILGAAVLIILLVVFGNNPVENARRAHAKAMQGKDPLVAAIEEHNKKKQFLGIGGTGSSGIAYPSGGQPAAAPGGIPRYMMNPTNPYQNPQPYPQNSNSYYPPAPAGTAPSPLQQPLQPDM